MLRCSAPSVAYLSVKQTTQKLFIVAAYPTTNSQRETQLCPTSSIKTVHLSAVNV